MGPLLSSPPGHPVEGASVEACAAQARDTQGGKRVVAAGEAAANTERDNDNERE